MYRNNKIKGQYAAPAIISVDICHEGMLCTSDSVFENESFDGCTDYGTDGWN